MRISDWSSDVCSSDLLSKRLTHGYRTTLCESFVQFLDGGQVVEIVDHHPRTLPQPLFRAVGHPVQLFEPGAIAEVEPGDRIDRAAFPVLGFHQIPDRACKKPVATGACIPFRFLRSEEHTSELQSLMRIPYAVFFWTKKQKL